MPHQYAIILLVGRLSEPNLQLYLFLHVLLCIMLTTAQEGIFRDLPKYSVKLKQQYAEFCPTAISTPLSNMVQHCTTVHHDHT